MAIFSFAGKMTFQAAFLLLKKIVISVNKDVMTAALYVHIPFCLSKCDYCDFFSVSYKNKIPDSFVLALIKEASFYATLYNIESWNTIYIGGGTPSLLQIQQIECLLNALNAMPLNNGSSDREVTVEMNPETASKELLDVASACGVKRISLGIQSLSDSALNSVNRRCKASIARKSLEMVKKYWRGDLNLDVIAGLPCASTCDFVSSLKEILSYNPQHVSLYSLSIEDGTPLERNIKRGKIKLDEDEGDTQWLLGRDILLERGFSHYEVSNFALTGHESLHNLTYWRQKDYIGIGPGASGTIYNADGSKRWTNTHNIEKYIDFWTHVEPLECISKEKLIDRIPCENEVIDLQNAEYEFLMMGLRVKEGVSESEYNRRFKNLLPYKGNLKTRLYSSNGVWEDFIKTKKAKFQNGRAFLLEEGMLFLNLLLRNL